jgi:hypothetical protein
MNTPLLSSKEFLKIKNYCGFRVSHAQFAGLEP